MGSYLEEVESELTAKKGRVCTATAKKKTGILECVLAGKEAITTRVRQGKKREVYHHLWALCEKYTEPDWKKSSRSQGEVIQNVKFEVEYLKNSSVCFRHAHYYLATVGTVCSA